MPWIFADMVLQNEAGEDVWRTKVQTYPELHLASSNFGVTGADPDTGAPLPSWTLYWLVAGDAQLLINDPSILRFPVASTEVNDVSQARWSEILDGLIARDLDVSWIRGTHRIGDVIDWLGRMIDPAFTHTQYGT